MEEIANEHNRLLKEIGWSSNPFWKFWAKLEIFLGLTAVAIAVLIPLEYRVSSVLLFVLGGYLAMAGHRSHMYQSNNRLTAYLAKTVKDYRSHGTKSDTE